LPPESLESVWLSQDTRGLLTVLPKAEILPRLDSVKVAFTALVFVCALTLLVSLLFSFVPLQRAPRNQPSDALKVEGRGASAGTGKRRLGQMFVVSEFVFLAVLLVQVSLMCSALTLASTQKTSWPFGFQFPK
jgi:predicted lysophospholipase L1 biosynthesis ABC-type transport system permease subunit